MSIAGTIAAPKLAFQDDEKAVKEAAKQFYVALNAIFTGDLTPMKEVWSHEDDVTYMGPSVVSKSAGSKYFRIGRHRPL